MPLKINGKTILLYACCGAAMVFANCAVKGVPLSFGIFFAMMLCGMNLIAAPILFALSSIVNLNLLSSLIFIFAAAFCTAITFLYRKTGKKIKFEGLVYAVIALAPYVALAPWQGGDFFIENDYALRAIAAGVVLVFGFFCFKTVYSLLFRLQRCRLREDELVCIAVVYAVCGAGMATLTGVTFYLCVSAGITVLSVRLTRSPAAIIAALVTAVPCAVIELTPNAVTAFLVITTCALVFSGAGRFSSGIVTAAAFAVYAYFTGRFDCPVVLIVVYSLLLFLFCFLPSLPKDESYARLKRRLCVTEVLTDTAVARSRKCTGEKLYRISEVFKEIENAFNSIDDAENDEGSRDALLFQLKEKCCKGCERQKRCEPTSVYAGFRRLIDAGCVKGKVNLIDLPSETTANCFRPADVLSALNGLLAEYRRHMTENENARAGRTMLAEQAHGVADVMKSCAVDLSRVYDYGGVADGVKKALSVHGICCPEVYIDGDNGDEICAATLGKVNVTAFEKIISDAMKRRYVLKDKIVYDEQKSCLIFSAPPKLDAAFGVAYAVKKGEKVSGDTHSVIRVNEKSFLMALSDGMGSGDYARKVSESAISLIEAFYRAEMPADTVLNVINKLLSFNRDERFTCIDIAAINLDTGRADFVKIGSPAGIIMREGEIKILESSSLPLGILDTLHPATSTETLKNGDIVVFMSDGITSAFPSATDLYEFLQDFKPLNPQNLADKILAGALEKTGHEAVDDMTVLCTRIFEN